MKIREYSSKDKLKVKRLINESLKEIYGVPLPEHEWEDLNSYKKSGGVFYLAEDKGKLVGCVAIENRKTYGKWKRMYIRKDYFGTGLSNKLLDKLIKFSIKNRIKTIRLTTHKRMKRAQAFYKKSGFKKVGKILGYTKFSMRIKWIQ